MTLDMVNLDSCGMISFNMYYTQTLTAFNILERARNN